MGRPVASTTGTLGAVQSKPPGMYIAMNGEVFDADDVQENVATNRFEHKT